MIPEILNPDREGQALIYITGGSNGQSVNINDQGFGDEDLTLAAELAVRTGTYVTIVYNNPNEPIRFLDEEGQPRYYPLYSFVFYLLYLCVCVFINIYESKYETLYKYNTVEQRVPSMLTLGSNIWMDMITSPHLEMMT